MTDANQSMKEAEYGPLAGLIGLWTGDKGMDFAPEPDGPAESPFYETLEFTACGDVENAESQVIWAIRYQQTVSRKSNNEVFHNQTGYWMWDASRNLVMQSLTIPRAVCVLAGGRASEADGTTTLTVKAAIDDPDWGVIQSPFMRDNARTLGFSHSLSVSEHTLSYAETTVLEIYGRRFDHTDSNNLRRKGRTGDRK